LVLEKSTLSLLDLPGDGKILYSYATLTGKIVF
jgi:hypothetical protein